jgi:predicted AAA+ superfamily ATPase
VPYDIFTSAKCAKNIYYSSAKCGILGLKKGQIMKRKMLTELIKWKNSQDRKPLLLQGARQVGKTYLLKQFGAEYYQDTIYINFENPDSDVVELFAGQISPTRIIEFLSLKYAKTIEAANTLIIFDEVQELPRALTSLKYFQEDAPAYHVIASGSLLGVGLHAGTSFPVGKVNYLRLQPLDFEEYLWAMGKADKVQYITDNPEDQQITFNDELKDDLYQYLALGGMPEAVQAWVTKKDFAVSQKILSAIVTDYQNDFSKYTSNLVAEKIKHVWQSIPAQFAKENHKFVYGVARPGARARDLELAIQWLIDAGLIRKVNLNVVGDKLPFLSYQDTQVFKLYLLDVGLLRVLAKLPPSAIIGGENIFHQFGGAFAEQYVLQQLQFGNENNDVCYWTGVTINRENQVKRKTQSEVDFLVAVDEHIVPIEVKSGTNVKAKSLKVFRDKYHPALVVRFSLLPVSYNQGHLNIPLYKPWLFTKLVSKYLP